MVPRRVQVDRRGARGHPRVGRRARGRGVRHGQRPREAVLGGGRRALHGGGHGRLDGRLHELRRGDHEGRHEADPRVQGAARLHRRLQGGRRGAEGDGGLRLRRPHREDPGGRGLDSRGRDRQRADPSRRVEFRAGAAARVAVEPGRRGVRRHRRDREALRGPRDERLRHAGDGLVASGLRHRAPGVALLGHGGPLLQRPARVARLQGGHWHAHLHEDDRVPAPAGPREP